MTRISIISVATVALAAMAAAQPATRFSLGTFERDGKDLKRYEGRLARALAGVINVLDPDVVVLGGGISNIQSLYAHVPEKWKPYVFSDTVATRLKPPVHGDSSGVRGAAWLWGR